MWDVTKFKTGSSFHKEILESVPVQSRRVYASPPMPLLWADAVPSWIAVPIVMAAAAAKTLVRFIIILL
jgi:hypothetical protein